MSRTEAGRAVIDLTRDLVAIDSVNPSLVPGAAGEVQIAAYVGRPAGGRGFHGRGRAGARRAPTERDRSARGLTSRQVRGAERPPRHRRRRRDDRTVLCANRRRAHVRARDQRHERRGRRTHRRRGAARRGERTRSPGRRPGRGRGGRERRCDGGSRVAGFRSARRLPRRGADLAGSGRGPPGLRGRQGRSERPGRAFVAARGRRGCDACARRIAGRHLATRHRTAAGPASPSLPRVADGDRRPRGLGALHGGGARRGHRRAQDPAGGVPDRGARRGAVPDRRAGCAGRAGVVGRTGHLPARLAGRHRRSGRGTDVARGETH